jgi:short-subunit dehydrogenase
MKVGTAVVTGASSGIGAATARRLAAAGWQVTLVARRLERLLGLHAEIGNAEVLAADLSSEAERVRIFEQIRETDVLINSSCHLVLSERQIPIFSHGFHEFAPIFSTNL